LSYLLSIRDELNRRSRAITALLEQQHRLSGDIDKKLASLGTEFSLLGKSVPEQSVLSRPENASLLKEMREELSNSFARLKTDLTATMDVFGSSQKSQFEEFNKKQEAAKQETIAALTEIRTTLETKLGEI
jgi:hypothetical protein